MASHYFGGNARERSHRTSHARTLGKGIACTLLLSLALAGYVLPSFTASNTTASSRNHGGRRSRALRTGPSMMAAAIDMPPTGYDTQRKILKVVKWPHAALRRKNEEVTVFDEKLHMLAVNLFDTLRKEGGGVGLAAPQVGVNMRVMAYFEVKGEKAVGKLLVNPRIVKRGEDTDVDMEECLSFPGVKGPVVRPTWVEVEAQTIDGKVRNFRIEGNEARLFQHEYDHLDGVVFIDHLDKATLDKNLLKLQNLKNEYMNRGGMDPMP
eukprot:CAMPEP_0172709602 /NCGR_PEP_ID=MMETSP1074-20121228/55163_1 /TAXON_ID=2916 /ORGANISM="Ceratium fusus, Strain PA161109" /LENGTH=265 /DNA_ID=CAMNT_0013532885 /DNA_START=35 /DNA_END=832 /DNA_ORIENTATION=+